MGADKAALDLGGQPLLARAVERLRPQVHRLAVIGGPEVPARELGCEWHKDALTGDKGPLAGILTALEWSQAEVSAPVLISAVDMPFLPLSIGRSLVGKHVGVEICCARSNGRPQFMASIWRAELAEPLRDFLRHTEDLSIRAFAAQCRVEMIDFVSNKNGAPDPFLNLNTPEDLGRAEEWLQHPS